ncbi:hypothetical protein ACHAW5_010397 [Stephanodiscus triporus]|uniref:Uncharacterized protein n=1 Tax=Stephanodiscus triporus TaxID=2934178 RepID=A0ABD3PK35_9STRA
MTTPPTSKPMTTPLAIPILAILGTILYTKFNARIREIKGLPMSAAACRAGHLLEQGGVQRCAMAFAVERKLNVIDEFRY